jgi:hypothetical protein
MKVNSIKIDLAKAEAGIWVGDIPDFEGVRLKVRPANNPDFRHLYSQLVETTPRHLKRGGMVRDKDTRNRIGAICLADTVLLDWEGFEDDAGKPLKYTAELAKQWLLDPEMAAFRDAVSWAGNVAEEETRLGFEENSGN